MNKSDPLPNRIFLVCAALAVPALLIAKFHSPLAATFVSLSIIGIYAFFVRIESTVRSFSRLTGDGRTLSAIQGSAVRAGDSLSYTKNDRVLTDATIVEGAALVDESVLTGESAPTLRDSTPGRNQILEGSRIVSGSLDVVAARARETSNRFASREAFYPLNAQGSSNWFFKLPLKHLISVIACVVVLGALSSAQNNSFFIFLMFVLSMSPALFYLKIVKLLDIATIDRLFHRHLLIGNIDALNVGAQVTDFVKTRASIPKIPIQSRVADVIASEISNRERCLEAAQWVAMGGGGSDARELMIFLKRQPGFHPAELDSKTVHFTGATDSPGLSGAIIYNDEGEDGLRSIMLGPLVHMRKHIEGLGHQIPPALEARSVELSQHGETCLFLSEGPLVIGLVQFRGSSKSSAAVTDHRWDRLGIKVHEAENVIRKAQLLNALAAENRVATIQLNSADELRIADLGALSFAIVENADELSEASDVIALSGGASQFTHFVSTARERFIALKRLKTLRNVLIGFIFLEFALTLLFSQPNLRTFFSYSALPLFHFRSFQSALLSLFVVVCCAFCITGAVIVGFHQGRGSFFKVSRWFEAKSRTALAFFAMLFLAHGFDHILRFARDIFL